MADPLPSTIFPYVVGKAVYTRLLIEVAFALWLVLLLWYPSHRLPRSRLLWALAIYLAVVLLASLTGVSLQRSLWSTYERMQGWVGLLHYAAFTVMLASVFRDFRSWYLVLNLNLLVGLALGLLGVSQMAGLSPGWLLDAPRDQHHPGQRHLRRGLHARERPHRRGVPGPLPRGSRDPAHRYATTGGQAETEAGQAAGGVPGPVVGLARHADARLLGRGHTPGSADALPERDEGRDRRAGRRAGDLCVGLRPVGEAQARQDRVRGPRRGRRSARRRVPPGTGDPGVRERGRVEPHPPAARHPGPGRPVRALPVDLDPYGPAGVRGQAGPRVGPRELHRRIRQPPHRAGRGRLVPPHLRPGPQQGHRGDGDDGRAGAGGLPGDLARHGVGPRPAHP